MDLRLSLAIATAKIISKLNRLHGTGGTAAPGLYALKIEPNLVRKLINGNHLESIVVSGTNGKTTTARLISAIIGQENLIHNRHGSNLLRGVASTLTSASSLTGSIDNKISLFEADEAALVDIASQVNPKILVLINLFRDQLDRYGEIDTTRKKWIKVVKNLPKESTLILNADDPSINYLREFATCKVISFGVQTRKLDLPAVENVQDIKYCIKCSHKLTYSKLYSAHLGVYRCTNCDFARLEPDIRATDLTFHDNFSTTLKANVNREPLTVNYPLPGLYNAYNALAAVSVASELAIGQAKIISAVKSFNPAFGRFQSVQIRDKSALIFLIKNPAGANEVIRTIATKQNLNLLVALNDNIADGRDVSWIWDTNWEALVDNVSNITISGIRRADMALRLKYAGFKKLRLQDNISNSLALSLSITKPGGQLFILPTYTALLEVEQALGELGGIKWHKE